MSDQTTPRRLYRSATDMVFAGVAGGLGEHFDVDSNLVRIAFLIASFFGGLGLLIYVACWFLIPLRGQESRQTHEHVEAAAEEMRGKAEEYKEKAEEWAGRFERGGEGSAGSPEPFARRSGENRTVIGGFLVLLGILFLLNNFQLIDFGSVARLWPLVLLLAGFAILARRR